MPPQNIQEHMSFIAVMSDSTDDQEQQPAPNWASLVVNGIEAMLFSVDTEWRFTYLNRRASEVLGVSQAALLGNVMWDMFPTLIGSSFERLYRQAMADGKPGRLEDFSHTTRAWYDVQAYPIPQGLIIYFQDISVRKLAEEQIRQQVERTRVQAEVSRALSEVTHDYQGTLDTATQLLAEVVGDGCIMYLLSQDEQWLEHVALHHRDPQAAAFVRDILVGAPYNRVNEGLAGRVVQTGQPVLIPSITLEQLKSMTYPRHWEYFDRFAIYSALLAPLRATGRVIGVITMTRHVPDQPYTKDDQALVQDLADRVAIAITNARLLQQVQRELAERVKVEEALRASEARFTSIVASAMDAIISTDESQRIVVFNAAAEYMFRCSAATVIGQPLDQFLPVSVRHLHAQHIREFGQTGIISRPTRLLGPLTAIRTSGEEFPIEATISQTLAAGQQLYTVIMRDITEQKQAEVALQKTQAQLLQSQKMESMGQLAGGIAHDFNNLLSVIIGYCEMSLWGLAESDPLYTDIIEIQTAGTRAAALVRQILAFSRQQLLDLQVVNLNDIVANLDTMLHRVIGEHIELVSLLAPQLDPVMVDPGQIEQVIVNLVVNARDAMPEGGKITIETTCVELDEQYHSTGQPDLKAGAYVLLAVSDTGTGMDQATQEKIFEPFFTTKEPGKGTGLGLATVYGIVRQSEGYIWLSSELGVGTTFKVYLPIIKDRALVSAPTILDARESIALSLASIEHTGHGRTVLVVEDDALVRALIHQVLTHAGYAIVEAHNGHEALTLLATHSGRIDVVLTDIVMPKMGGWALVEGLKQRWPELKIICMSGYTDRAMLSQGIERPYDMFLQKPFTPRTLLHGIADLLKKADSS